jgi:hypothetical protein
MPYYKNKNILFIHIPKTGGTSIEFCLKKNDKETLFSDKTNSILPEKELRLKSLQHQTYQTIYKYKKLLKIPFDDNMRIISIVRNPYTRLVSDLFWNNLITENTKKEKVTKIIKNYIVNNNLDNHNIPQYNFLVDENDILIENIKIFKMENLNEEFNNYLGYKLKKYNKNKLKINYFKYLNKNSINIINDFYSKDFELFNYEKLN